MKTPSKTPGSPRDFRELSRLANMKTGNFLLVAKMSWGTSSLVPKMSWGTFFTQTGNFLTRIPNDAALPPYQWRGRQEAVLHA